MKLKKLMKIFFVLFLISLFITIGLFIAMKKQPINRETVTAKVVSNERVRAVYSTNPYSRGRGVYRVTVRSKGHEGKWYVTSLGNPGYYRNMEVEAYISPDGHLAESVDAARRHSIPGKMYCVFLIITGVLFMAFIIVYDKIWKIKHGKQKTVPEKSG